MAENKDKNVDYKGWLDQIGKSFADIWGAVTGKPEPGSGRQPGTEPIDTDQENHNVLIFGAIGVVIIIVILLAIFKK